MECGGDDHCDGASVVRCINGRLAAPEDCAFHGKPFTCLEKVNDDGHVNAFCHTAEPDCDSWGDGFCDGDVQYVCYGGKLIPWDCSILPGGTCMAYGDGGLFCGMPGE